MDNKLSKEYEKRYDGLNPAQRMAVDEIDGPVMVVAGPGTGKTEILALRIGNILKKTDTSPDSILCLTFTNSGVSAMQERLERYIGSRSRDVVVSTFHSFAYRLVEKYYEFLDFPELPALLSDNEAVFLIDEILNENDWEYLRPRANPAMYFNELKQLVSVLKRERIYASDLLLYIEEDKEKLKNDPESISTRGESKGKLKKEVEKKLEHLGRTTEVVKFYEIYEEKKKEKSFLDYDDVLECAVRLVEGYDDIKKDLQENFQYVLVDEHQDSSGVQNSFLKAVWQEVEKPNIFVVGDDRQLIYAFSGAKLSYFEEFSDIFKGAKKIVLTENYRSTAPILSLADELLKSQVTSEKLNSNRKGDHKIILSEYNYPRDEIIGAGLFFKEKIKEGIDPNECALLVPKNYNVRQAIDILSGLDLPVSSGKNLSLFSVRESDSLRRVLGIIANPSDQVLLAETILDKESGIPYLLAHNFLRDYKGEELTIEKLINCDSGDNLFKGTNPIALWGNKLKKWVNDLAHEKPSTIVSRLGNEYLINTSKDNEEILSRAEVVRSFIHLAMLFEEKIKKPDLVSFLEYINRLESYGTHIELAKFGNDNGVKVMTLHKSKGLQYECVWVAHMNEETLMSEKRGGFTLPEKIKEHIKKRSIEEAKRELYVAITRAKDFCVLSYANENYNGGSLELATIIRDLSDVHFIKKSASDTEKEILKNGAMVYTKEKSGDTTNDDFDIKKLVQDHYREIKVSVSMLNNFFECPWKWYFRNFLRLPEEKPMHLAVGTVAHAIIEYVLKSKGIPEDEVLVSRIESELKSEGLTDKNDLRRFTKEIHEIIRYWIENYYDKLHKDFKSERSVSLVDKKNFPNLQMYGKIDLTEYVNDDEVWVTDFKTGSVKTSGMIEKIDEDGRMSDLMRQLSMYSYLLSNDNTKVVNSRLLFLEGDIKNKNSLYETAIDQEKIDLLKKDIKEYDEALSSGSWTERECHFKPFKSGEECEYCKLKNQIFK